MYDQAVVMSQNGLCSNGCVIVTHSTGDLTTRYFLAHQEDWLAAAGITAVLDFAGAGGGTEGSYLIVDDEEGLRKLAEEILSSHGYRVITADSAECALKLLDEESVDLLLSDIIMPGMSGYELAEIVKKNHPDIKIQMASGYSHSSNDTNYNEDLHIHKLKKPYKIKELLHRIRVLLG